MLTALCAPADTGRINFMRIQAVNPEFGSDRRIAYYDSLLATSPKDSRKLMYEKSVIYRNDGELVKCGEILDQLIEGINSDPIGMQLNIMFDKAYIASKGRDLETAYRQFDKIIQMPKPDSLRYFDALATIHKGHLFSAIDRYTIFSKYVTQADSILNSLDTTAVSHSRTQYVRARIMIMHATGQFATEEFDKAYRNYIKAMEIYPSKQIKVTCNNGLGILFSVQGDHLAARQYFLKAMENTAGVDHALLTTNYLITFADNGEYRQMLDEAHRLSDDLECLDESPQESKFWAVIAEAYDVTGDYESAYRSLQRAFRLRNNIDEHLSNTGLDQLIYRIEKENMDAAISQLSRRSTAKTIVIAIMGVLLAGAAVIIFHIKRRGNRTADHRISNDITHHNPDKADDTAVRLDERNRQIATMSINLARMSDVISAVRRESADADRPKEARLSAIRTIVRDVAVKQDVWEFVKTSFEQANPTFFKRLLTINPKLTSSELRICAFSLAGMSVKEIAQLTSRSVHTIESIRYSLRKKLSIDGPTDIWIKKLAVMSDDEFSAMTLSHLPVE